MSKQEINFSIIIPHHNTPELLVRCLDSIPLRNDLEIIVVDDNSSPEIVDFNNFPGKGRHDTKIILDKKGGGGGYARNKGLAEAKGKWVLFADSDDFFTYCLGEMLDKYVDAKVDIIYFKALSLDTLFYTAGKRANYYNRWVSMAKIKPGNGEVFLRYYASAPWSKLIKRDIIVQNNIRFDETPIHNDVTFSYLVGFYAKNIEVDEHALYAVTERINSVSVSLSDMKRLIRVEVFAREEKFLKENLVESASIVERHYQEVFIMLVQGKWSLFCKGVEIIKRYVNSSTAIYFRIIYKAPHFIFKAWRKKFESMTRNLF